MGKKVQENLVKRACRELGVTQKELAEILGVNEGTPAQWSSKNNMPKIAEKFIFHLLEKNKLEIKINKIIQALEIIEELKKNNTPKNDIKS